MRKKKEVARLAITNKGDTFDHQRSLLPVDFEQYLRYCTRFDHHHFLHYHPKDLTYHHSNSNSSKLFITIKVFK